MEPKITRLEFPIKGNEYYAIVETDTEVIRFRIDHKYAEQLRRSFKTKETEDDKLITYTFV